MVQWKGRLPAGRVDDRPVIQLDILPTSLAAAGIVVKEEWKLDGIDLLPYLLGKKKSAPHDALYWRFGEQMAIRMGDWKLVKAPGAGVEEAGRRGKADPRGARLFNLRMDIGEKVDLSIQEPRKVGELAAAWQRWNSQLMDPLWGPPARAARATARRRR
jgi:arylsulfatase A-like enzyme